MGDEPVCESFFVSSFDRLFHQIFSEFKFGGVRYGLSGEAALTDPDRDNLIDGFVDGRMQLHLPPVTAESTVNAESDKCFVTGDECPRPKCVFRHVDVCMSPAAANYPTASSVFESSGIVLRFCSSNSDAE